MKNAESSRLCRIKDKFRSLPGLLKISLLTKGIEEAIQ